MKTKFEWSALPYVTDSQCREVQKLLDRSLFVTFISKSNKGSIELYSDCKLVRITKLGRVTSSVTADSIKHYLAQLFDSDMLYHVDDEPSDLVWSTPIQPTDYELKLLSLAHEQLTAWRYDSKQCVFELYPEQSFLGHKHDE